MLKFCVSWGCLWEEGEKLSKRLGEPVRETVCACMFLVNIFSFYGIEGLILWQSSWNLN